MLLQFIHRPTNALSLILGFHREVGKICGILGSVGTLPNSPVGRRAQKINLIKYSM